MGRVHYQQNWKWRRAGFSLSFREMEWGIYFIMWRVCHGACSSTKTEIALEQQRVDGSDPPAEADVGKMTARSRIRFSFTERQWEFITPHQRKAVNPCINKKVFLLTKLIFCSSNLKRRPFVNLFIFGSILLVFPFFRWHTNLSRFTSWNHWVFSDLLHTSFILEIVFWSISLLSFCQYWPVSKPSESSPIMGQGSLFFWQDCCWILFFSPTFNLYCMRTWSMNLKGCYKDPNVLFWRCYAAACAKQRNCLWDVIAS